jgi:hypothetical protein
MNDHLSATHPPVAARMVFMTGGAITWRAPEFVASRVLCIEKQFEISRVRKMIGSPVRCR